MRHDRTAHGRSTPPPSVLAASPASLAAVLTAVVPVVEQAGDVVREHQRPLEVQSKSDGTPVTEVDRLLHERMVPALSSLLPGVPVISEEDPAANMGIISMAETNNPADHTPTPWPEWVWLLDPLDATAAFVARIAVSTVTLSLLHRGTPVLAVTHDPWTHTTWSASASASTRRTLRNRASAAISNSAESGYGVSVSPRQTLREAAIAVEGGHHRHTVAAVLTQHWARWFSLGATARALAAVSDGSIDGVVLGASKPWDIAAGLLLVKQAGGIVLDLEQERAPEPELLVSAGPGIRSPARVVAGPRLAHQLLDELGPPRQGP